MALINSIIAKRWGKELVDWVYIGMREGMILNAKRYSAIKAQIVSKGGTDFTEALKFLKAAISKPKETKERLQQAVTTYSKAEVDAAVRSYTGNTVTIDDLIADISECLSYAATLVTAYKTGAKTPDELALMIQTDVVSVSEKMTVPLPANYTDAFGE